MSYPLLGFGLDWQFADRYPSGIEGLCGRYCDRLSHLSIVSLFNEDRAKYFKSACAVNLPIVHHLPGVAPADPDGPHLELLTRLDGISKILNAVWICEDIAIWSIGPYGIPYFTPPIFETEIAVRVAEGIRQMQEISSVPFIAEVPSCALVVGRLSLGEFFRIVVEKSNCHLLADVSHIYSYSIATRQSPSSVLHSLPLDRVWEIHIAGGHIDQASEQRYIDTHSEPVLDEILELLADAATSCPNLQGITYEVGVGLTAAGIENDVSRIEGVLNQVGWRPNMSSRRTASTGVA